MNSNNLSRQLSVSSQANIFCAGLATLPSEGMEGGIGELPPYIMIAPGRDRVISFTEVKGEILGKSNGSPHSAEGESYDGYGVNIQSYKGISGIKVEKKCMCLVGVFLPLGEKEPTEPAPDALTFNKEAQDSEKIGAELFQIFFIGNGKTSNNSLQSFVIPPKAGKLYLGFACGYNCGQGGSPGYYQDNTGTLDVTLSIARRETTREKSSVS